MLKPAWLLGCSLLGLTLSAAALPAAAETQEVRFGRQLGIGYLQLYIMEELQLVEKHAKAAGLGDIKASYKPVGAPAVLNDLLLGNSVDLIAAGTPPFIVLWDKTVGNIAVKGVSTLNSQPSYLNTNKPNIKSLRDFTDKDKIALPSVKVSFQAIALQMAAEKEFGPGQHTKLDALTVSLAHPEGVAALLSPGSEITGHFTSPPFQYQELENPKISRVVSSYDVTGKSSFSALSATKKFVDDNPKTYQALLAALKEATKIITGNPDEAVRIFIKIDQSKLSHEFLKKMITDKDFSFSLAPENIAKLTDFMHRTGSIKNKPASWKDLFHPGIHDLQGS
ncbi:MAG: ABC transporter substrate-binding protein [Alphaproteobacteria bacterium]|nr:ABC transporter substrate-binding protein [Alphaproteobacteria bacterium]